MLENKSSNKTFGFSNWRTCWSKKKSGGQDPGELVGKLGEVSRPCKCLSPSGQVFILSTNPFSETDESECTAGMRYK